MKIISLKIPPVIHALGLSALMLIFSDYKLINHEKAFLTTLLGIFVAIIGIGFLGISVYKFNKNKTTVNPLKPQNSNILVTEGIYSHTRNPMYVGFFLVLLGWGVFLGNLLSILLALSFVWIINLSQIIPEEAILEKLFGNKYLSYKNKVPRWFFFK